MTLPDEFAHALTNACLSQNLQIVDTERWIEDLVAGDRYLGYSIWAGPAFGQQNLKLDVYILGERCLYNFVVYEGGREPGNVNCAATVQFLDVISAVHFVQIADERSPYMLATRREEELGRIFGGPLDRERLESFRKKLVAQILAVKTRGA